MFKDSCFQWEQMVMGPKTMDKPGEPESTERLSNALLVTVFPCDTLTTIKIQNISSL